MHVEGGRKKLTEVEKGRRSRALQTGSTAPQVYKETRTQKTRKAVSEGEKGGSGTKTSDKNKLKYGRNKTRPL